MTKAQQRAERYEFLRGRSYPMLWNPYMCDTFMDFESSLAPADLLRAPELLAELHRVGTEHGVRGAGDLTLAEMMSGCRNREPLIMDFVWRAVKHVATTLLQVPRSSINPEVMKDLQQEMLLQLVNYEPRYSPNVSDGAGDGAASLAGYFYRYPVMRASDAFKRLLYGGRSVSLEKNGAFSLEGQMVSNDEDDGFGLENMLSNTDLGHDGLEMDASLIGDHILSVMTECTPKEKDVVALCLAMLGNTDEEVGKAMDMSKIGAWHRRQAFSKAFPPLLRESLAQESLSGIANGKDLAQEMCFGRLDGRSAVDSRITTAPEVQDLQWDKLPDIWEDLLSGGGR